MMITGNIENMQTLTGYIGSTGIKGIITKQDSQSSVKGYVQNRQTLTGHIKNVNGITGIITNMPEQSAKSDHVFVIVDLLQMHEQRIIYHNANVVVSLTAQSSQPVSKQIDISAVPVVVAVNSVTAGYASFSNNSITVQSAIAIKEEVNE